MQRKSRLTILSVVLIIMALAMGPANAQAPHGPEVAACLPGAGYAPGCDVDQNGVIDIIDAWANANRIPVEQDKPTEERGLYLHPEALGQPKSLGLDHQRKALLPDRLDTEETTAR